MERTIAAPVEATAPVDEGAGLLEQLELLREDMLALSRAQRPGLEQVAPEQRGGSENLLDYLALRRHDLRPLQERLAQRGLSSLGRSEAHARANVEAVIGVLQTLTGRASPPSPPCPFELGDGEAHLAGQTTALLGAKPANRDVRIMVTMPSAAARDYALVHDLVRGGMDCMRINCAHDDAKAWARMIANLRKAEQASHRRCHVVMDLAGPKLRTGPVATTPGVVKCHPERDDFGRLVAPARVWFFDRARRCEPPTPADACLPLPSACLARLQPGDRVEFRDARDARREMRIVDRAAGGAWAEAFRTAYVSAATTLRFRPRGGGAPRAARIGPLEPREGVLRLETGDTLVVTRSLEPGRPARHDSRGRLLSPASIGCTLTRSSTTSSRARASGSTTGRSAA